MTPPSISVVIPAYNAAACLREAVDSVLTQTLPPLEILVVDDGSSDDTAAIAQSYGPPVRCLRRANGGLPAARNTGIDAASGEWIALLDADDAWGPEHLAGQAALARHTAADLVFSDAEVIGPSRRWESWLERSGHQWVLRNKIVLMDRPYSTLLRRGSFVLPSTVLVRRAVIAAVGGFDAALRPGPEDLDLWLRLAPSTRWAFNDKTRIKRSEAETNLSRNRAGMANGAVRLWKKALASAPAGIDPELRRLLRARLARAHWEAAYWSTVRGEFAQSRHAAWRSLAVRWSWRTFFFALAAGLPRPVIRALQRLRASSLRSS